ncbi:MAG: PLP-dependent aminotransferase family protein, partial [Rhodanobacteraceae bacterium]
MSLPRRPQLLDWAAERHAWILEDDCDSEYRFAGELIAALRGLDNADRVNLFRHLQQGDLAGPA